MAWTVGFALLGAVIFSITVAPVLASFFFRGEDVRLEESSSRMAYQNVSWGPCLGGPPSLGNGLRRAFRSLREYLTGLGHVIGSEFLPHLDEGSLWVRGTLAPSTGPSESIRLTNQVRILLCSFPEVTEVTSQTGRPDDGTDTTGFFNTEYYVGLKPKEQWRPAFTRTKRN